jgi:hypothetical protein
LGYGIEVIAVARSSLEQLELRPHGDILVFGDFQVDGQDAASVST